MCPVIISTRIVDRWLAITPLELEQKASLHYLLTSCSSEFVEFLNRLFTPPLAILGPLNCLYAHQSEILYDTRHHGVLSGVSKLISKHMVRSMQTMHLSCIKISNISKQIKPSFHLSLFTEVPTSASKMVS